MTSLNAAPARPVADAAELAAALDAVRFAVSTDPQLPMLGGILFDIEDHRLRLVATDRYRMAVAQVEVAGHDGPRVRAVVPAPLADAMRALLAGAATAHLSVDGSRVALEAGDRQVAGERLGEEFPDYRRLVRLPAGRYADVDVPALRQAVETGPVRAGRLREQDGVSYDVTLLEVSARGGVSVCRDSGDPLDHIAVNREFLLHALKAADRDHLIMEFAGPTAPLAIRRPDTQDTFSILMPVRLENQTH